MHKPMKILKGYDRSILFLLFEITNCLHFFGWIKRFVLFRLGHLIECVSCEYVIENLEHLRREEEQWNSLLSAVCNDDELMKIQGHSFLKYCFLSFLCCVLRYKCCECFIEEWVHLFVFVRLFVLFCFVLFDRGYLSWDCFETYDIIYTNEKFESRRKKSVFAIAWNTSPASFTDVDSRNYLSKCFETRSNHTSVVKHNAHPHLYVSLFWLPSFFSSSTHSLIFSSSSLCSSLSSFSIYNWVDAFVAFTFIVIFERNNQQLTTNQIKTNDSSNDSFNV
jgi:hypothetical protein